MTRSMDLVFLGNTFDSQSVFEQFEAHGRPCLLLEETVSHQFRVTRSHPPEADLPEWPWGRWRFRNNGPFSRLLFPVFYAAHILRFALYLVHLRRRGVRLKTVYILYGHYATILPMLKAFGLLDRWVFVMGDWFAESPGKTLLSRLGSRVVTPRIFRHCCGSADRTLYITEEIQKAQARFWGREISRESRIYSPILRSLMGRRPPPVSPFRMLFLGNILPESGLDRILPILAAHPRFRLVLIGPPSALRRQFLDLCRKQGVSPQVEDHGFQERSAIGPIAETCHCGLNLITRKVYSHYTLPAKIMDYLQCGLPVVCTDWVGPYHRVIRDKRLGCVLPESLTGLEKRLKHLATRPVWLAHRARIKAHVAACRGTQYPLL